MWDNASALSIKYTCVWLDVVGVDVFQRQTTSFDSNVFENVLKGKDQRSFALKRQFSDIHVLDDATHSVWD